MNILSAKEFQGVVNSVPTTAQLQMVSSDQSSDAQVVWFVRLWFGRLWFARCTRGKTGGGGGPVDQIGSCRLMQFIILL